MRAGAAEHVPFASPRHQLGVLEEVIDRRDDVLGRNITDHRATLSQMEPGLRRCTSQHIGTSQVRGVALACSALSVVVGSQGGFPLGEMAPNPKACAFTTSVLRNGEGCTSQTVR